MKKIIALIPVFCLFLNVFYVNVNAEGENTELLSVFAELQTEVSAKACILMDRNTGTVLTAKNEHEALYPASVTKIMTLILVCEAIASGKLTLDMNITCSRSAAEKGGSQIWLEEGEIMTVNDLLKATVVYSANDACCLLAECVAGSEEAFCVLMNKKAEELGMNDTYFDNCTGLDDETTEHKTSAYDIALMSRELLGYELIRNYTSIWMDTLRNGTTQLVNTNKLMRYYSGATGLKTGTTSKAGCCISASAERDGLELIAVVLGADNSKDRFSSAQNLLDWGFANYEIFIPDASGKYPESVAVSHGTKKSVSLTHTQINDVIINKGRSQDISYEVEIADGVSAPVEKGDRIGKIVLKFNGQEIASCDILADESAEKMNFGFALVFLMRAFSDKL